jgi:hypothetical protein
MYLALAKREIDVAEPVVGDLGQGENRLAARRPGISRRDSWFVIRPNDACLLDLRERVAGPDVGTGRISR